MTEAIDAYRVCRRSSEVGTAVTVQVRTMSRARRIAAHPRLRDARGFTLIELLVVLALIGILALMVVPTVLDVILRSQIRNFAHTSESFVNFSRLRAIRGGRPVSVIFESRLNSEGEQLTTIRAMVDTDVDGTPDQLINQDALPLTVKLKAPGGEDVLVGLELLEGTVSEPRLAQITFNSDGSVTETGAIRFGDPRGNFFELAIGPSRAVGRVVVRKWDGNNWWARGDGPHDWQWL